MKYTWEAKDFEKDSGHWGLMAAYSDELVIIGGLRVTSLQDGHSWQYPNACRMAADFNKLGYEPVLAPVNPSVVIKQLVKKKFNHSVGFTSS